MPQDNAYILPIIVLNWNRFDDTKECVDSILASHVSDVKIYLIDNGSELKDVDGIKEYYGSHPDIDLTFHATNLGFTKAHNLILEKLINEGYRYVFLLNNDTVLEKTSLQLVKEYFTSGEIDMLSCKMINYQDRNLLDNAGHKILTSGEIIPIGHNQKAVNFNEGFENFGSCAGACLYSVQMLKEIGLFDEYFDTGYEDAELGFRAIISGYKSYFDPNIIVYHKMSQSVSKVFNYKFALKTQCNIIYTYFKLAHWQNIVLNFIPCLLRFVIITLISLLSGRLKYLKIQYHSLYIVLLRDYKKLILNRRKSKYLRKLSWWRLLQKHEFFLIRDIKNFYTFIIKGEKSYFEKY